MRQRGSHDHPEPVRALLRFSWVLLANYLRRDSHLSVNSLYEIVGKVINLEGGHGLGIRVLSSTIWPKNEQGQLPDIKLFEAVVDATHRYKNIFYEGEADTNGDAAGY